MASHVFAQNEFDYELERKSREKISYHLLIRNYSQACRLSKKAVDALPHSKALRMLYIESLSYQGSEKVLLRAWQQYSRDFSDDKYNDNVLEHVAKGILKKAEFSEPYISKMYRYAVASSFSDASSVESLKEALQDTNFAVRDMALNAALSHGDEVLCERIEQLLEKETVSSIRIKAMEVLMRIRGDQASALAEKMIQDPSLSSTEKLRLIIMRLDTNSHIERPQLQELVNSSNMIERLIAAYVFGYFNRNQDLDLLAQLINDQIQDVRLQAITSLGQLRIKKLAGVAIEEVMQPIIEGSNCELALAASWCSMLAGDDAGRNRFRDFLFHSDPRLRLEATSLIGYSLPYTQDIAIDFFQSHPDDFVRLNLSILMLTHRMRVPQACDEIARFLQHPQSAQFKPSLPSPMETIWPTSLLSEQEKVNSEVHGAAKGEIVHFCLLNLLAVVKDSRAHEMISKFLDTHHSSIALASMPQFLRSGSGQLLEIICSFFDSSDVHKRIQAAALVALMKKEEAALDVLYQSYELVDRQLKEVILKIIGQISSKSSIPFLVENLYEPSQSLRIVAATALMQCLRN